MPNLAYLRQKISELDHLPGDTTVLLTHDDANEEDSHDFLHEVDTALWDVEKRYEGGEKDPAPEGSRLTVFLV